MGRRPVGVQRLHRTPGPRPFGVQCLHWISFVCFLYERSICTHPFDLRTSPLKRVPGLGLALISTILWYQRRRCCPRLPTVSGFLLSLSTSRSALGGTSTKTFTTDGIASSGTPLLTVATPHHIEV